MPTIGIGKAFRDQDRAAATARGRSRRPPRDSSVILPEVAGARNCSLCGQRIPAEDAFFSEAGPTCGPCLSEAEVAEVHNSPWTDLIPTSLATVFFALIATPPLIWAVPASEMGGRAAIGFAVLTLILGASGFYLTLLWLRTARDAFIPTLHAAEPGLLRFVRGGLALGLALATLLVTVGVGALAVQ